MDQGRPHATDLRGTPAPRPRSLLERVKVRLQFTGWLQYGLVAAPALVCLAFAALAGWIGAWPALLFWPPLGVGLALLAAFVFDVVTVKFGLRPSEPLPARLDDVDAFDLIRARRSCRSFQDRNLTAAHLAELMDCVRVHTRTEDTLSKRPIRFEYVAAPLTVWPVVGAREFLVAIAPRTYNRQTVIDVGRALQQVVLQATRMGLSTCWIGPGADQKSIGHALGDRFDPSRDHVICVCAVGYASRFVPLALRSMRLLQHRRLPLTSLFFADPRFATPLDVETPPFNAFGRCYEVCQWSPSSFNGQTTRCAAVMTPASEGQQLARFDFCAATHSRYYAAVALGIWLANWESGCAALGQPGRFAVLSPEQRSDPDAPDAPHYDVSWLVQGDAHPHA